MHQQVEQVELVPIPAKRTIKIIFVEIVLSFSRNLTQTECCSLWNSTRMAGFSHTPLVSCSRTSSSLIQASQTHYAVQPVPQFDGILSSACASRITRPRRVAFASRTTKDASTSFVWISFLRSLNKGGVFCFVLFFALNPFWKLDSSRHASYRVSCADPGCGNRELEARGRPQENRAGVQIGRLEPEVAAIPPKVRGDGFFEGNRLRVRMELRFFCLFRGEGCWSRCSYKNGYCKG